MMSSRRPRVKIAANLSIRRAPKAQSAGEQQKLPEVDEVTPYVKDTSLASTEPNEDFPVENVPVETPPKADEVLPAPEKQDEQHFKLPKPVDELPRHVAPPTHGVDAIHISSQNIPATNIIVNNNNEEPMSPRKQEARFGYPFSLSRKRNRTESLTSNKSLPEGITVNKVARKIATKQEESQRTLENKKEIRKRLINIDNVKKQNLTMFDMIYYNPVNNPMQTPVLGTRSGSSENGQKVTDGRKSRSVSKSRSPTPLPAPPPAAVPKVAVQLTPQLKLGPNGEMILDEASLVIENEREKEIRDALASKDIVYQDEFSGNHGYYSRIKRTRDWTDEETIRFYRCLHTIGTDFSMMITLFPCRTRRDLKLKFKKEERLNLSLVNKALQHPKEFNLEELKQQFAQEDEEQERIRLQLEEETQEKLRQEKMNKKVVLEISKARNPKKRISKSQRAMIEKELEQSESEDISQTTSIPKQRRRKTTKDDIKQDDSATNLEASVNVAEPLESDHTGEISSRNLFDKQETASVTGTRKRRSVKRKVTKAKPEKKSANVSEDEEPNLCTSKPNELLTSKPNELLTVPDPVPYIPNGMVGDMLPSSQPTSASESNGANTIDIAIQTHTSAVDRQSSKTHENQLPLVGVPSDTPMEPVLQTSPVILLESLDAVNCHRQNVESSPGEQTSLTQELAPVVMKYDDGIGTDLEYLPLPGANAPVARKVRLDADTAYALDDSKESLIELEPATVISTVGKKTVAGTKKSKQSNELNTAANTSEAVSVGVQQPDESMCEIRQKIENDIDPTPSQQPLLKQSIDDDEYVAASDDGQEDECYVADEPIPEDDDYYSPKVEEEVDISKDGYLCDSVAEITIAKEEISAGEPLRGIPIEEVAGHSGTSKAEKQYEEVDLTELDVGDAVVAEGDNSLPGGTAAEEEEEDGAGAAFSLEDIDINSLVLVESQDASEPNKTIYEIYVINPETGQLSEKPLDVPPDVIGNIRAILEADDGGS